VEDKSYQKSEENQLTLKEKVLAKSRQAYKELTRDVRLCVCYMGLMIIKMGQIIATVYLNLWLSTFFTRDDAGLAQAKTLSSSLAGSSMGLAVILSIMFGYLADKWRISCLLQIAFLVRMCGLFMFPYIADAGNVHSPWTYVAVTGLNVGN
jgi:hypothetical protein